MLGYNSKAAQILDSAIDAIELKKALNELIYQYTQYVLTDTSFCGNKDSPPADQLYCLKIVKDSIFKE
jgi:hypothetical protein